MSKILLLPLLVLGLNGFAAETYSAYEDESYGPPTPSHIRVQGSVSRPKKAVHAKKTRAGNKPKLASATAVTTTPAKAENPSNAKRLEKLEAEVLEIRRSMKQPAQAAASAAVPEAPELVGSYDPVPSDQVSALVKRLDIVKKLVSIHGRAYDYRTMTTQQLEVALAQLEGTAPPKPKRHSATPRKQRVPQENSDPVFGDESDETLPIPPSSAFESDES